jgi:DNA-binding SARP family transcriptional activator/streptogramin lyase
MEFRILGPVEVVSDGRVVALGSLKQRALLVLLLLHVNEVVSRDRLIDDLWGERAPQTAATSLHTYVSQLRKLLEAGDGADPRVLVTRAPGYVLEVDADRVDLKQFELLVRRGKRALGAGDADAAADALAQALALWRGPPLQEFGSAPFAPAESLRLDELRISALEDRVEADLALGRHHDLVSELNALVAEHPYRERLCGQLMLALYRSGRQAEALEAYRKTRRSLADELGIEPGPALQELEQAILRHDPAIALDEQSTAAEPRSGATDRDDPSVPEQAPVRLRRPALRWRFVAAVVAVLAATTVSIGYAVRGGAPAEKLLAADSVGFVDAKSGRVTKTYAVGRGPRSLALTASAVWVANYQDETVTRIDRSTGHSVTIAVTGHPTGIIAYEGRVWAWTLEGLLDPIDPQYDTSSDPIRLTASGGNTLQPGSITAGGGFLWITAPETKVLRVDPANPARRLLITPDWGAGGPIIEQGGQAWVAGSGYTGYVFPIDDRTGVPGSGIDVGGPVKNLAFGDGHLWVISGGATREQPYPALRTVDLHDRLVQDTWHVGRDPAAVAVTAGSVWVASPTEASISRVDPSHEGVAKTIKLGPNPIALAADRDGIWVTSGTALP